MKNVRKFESFPPTEIPGSESQRPSEKALGKHRETEQVDEDLFKLATSAIDADYNAELPNTPPRLLGPSKKH